MERVDSMRHSENCSLEFEDVAYKGSIPLRMKPTAGRTYETVLCDGIKHDLVVGLLAVSAESGGWSRPFELIARPFFGLA